MGKEVVRQQQNNSDWGAACKELLAGETWKLYDYIVRHFLGTVSSNCKYEQTQAVIMCGEERFFLTGKKVTEPGFTGVMTWQAIPAEESIPQLKQGDKLMVKDVKLVDRQTSPPGYL